MKAVPVRNGGSISHSDDDEVCQDDLSGIWSSQFASESSEFVTNTRRFRETLEPVQLAARLLLEHGMSPKGSDAELMHSRWESAWGDYKTCIAGPRP